MYGLIAGVLDLYIDRWIFMWTNWVP